MSAEVVTLLQNIQGMQWISDKNMTRLSLTIISENGVPSEIST